MRLSLRIAAIAMVLNASALPVCAQSAARPRSDSSHTIALVNGENHVDLLGDRTRSEIFVAWRSNNNAHGSSTVAFYVHAPSDEGDAAGLWQVVPFFDGPHDGDAGREVYRTGEGADCTLSDLRVIAHSHRPVDVVTATRALGESFAARAAVRFDYYVLTKNADGTPGWPTYYFKHVRTASAKRDYCDVNTAFDHELGLGAKGLGHGEGGR